MDNNIIDKGLDIEIMDLSELTSQDSFVVIRLDVGSMPPHRAEKRLSHIANELPLCKKLKKRRIDFVVVGVSANRGSSVIFTFKYNEDIDDYVKELGDYDSAMGALGAAD